MSELISDCFINSANSTVYGGLALAQTNQLQSVINAAARVIIGGIPKFNHMPDYICDDLLWLAVGRRIESYAAV